MIAEFARVRPWLAPLYFIAVAAGLLALTMPGPVEVHDDSVGYMEMAQTLSIAGCFRATPAREVSVEQGRQTVRPDCFVTMTRPFMMPLALRLAGGYEGFNLVQNVVRVLAWSALAFAVLTIALPFGLAWMVHILVMWAAVELPIYTDAALTGDLNTSVWLLVLSALILLLYRGGDARWRVLALTGFHAGVFVLAFLRDSNVGGLLAFSVMFYLALMMVQRNAGLAWRPRRLLVHAGLTLTLIATNLVSINLADRDLHMANNIMFYLGGDYCRCPESSLPELYRHSSPDPDWFFANYPELATLGVPPHKYARGHPFHQWLNENVKSVWLHYVATHPLKFLRLIELHGKDLALEYYRFLPLHPHSVRVLFLALAASIALLIVRIRERWRLALLLTGGLAMTGADMVVSVIGDAPGAIMRYGHTAIVVLFVPLSVGLAIVAGEIVRMGRRMLARRTAAAASGLSGQAVISD